MIKVLCERGHEHTDNYYLSVESRSVTVLVHSQQCLQMHHAAAAHEKAATYHLPSTELQAHKVGNSFLSSWWRAHQRSSRWA